MCKNRKVKAPEKATEDGSIQLKTVVKNYTNVNNILCWSIEKYDELKNCAIYYQMYQGSDFSCVFKLIKTEKILYVALRCDIQDRRSLFFLANGDTSSRCYSEEIAGGLYVGEFPQEEVKSSMEDLTGLLKLVFTFVTDDEATYVRECEHPKLGEMSNLDVLCYDIGHMYLQGNNSDFTINSVGASFKVHKYILLVRSELFKKFFENQDHQREYSINASDGVMYLVLLYCYSGALPYVGEDCLKAILGVAEEFGISSLLQRCQEDLQRFRKDATECTEVPPAV